MKEIKPKIKLIIAGTRPPRDISESIKHNKRCLELIKQGWFELSVKYDIEVEVSGGGRGPDMLGESYADSLGVPVARFYVSSVQWEKYPKTAGHMRNTLMADYSNALLAIWDGKSGGTKDMIEKMKAAGKIFEVKYL